MFPELLADLGHRVIWEAPEEIADFISDFVAGPRIRDGRGGGYGHRRGSHTFSTSGRPRMPCGRKIITIARIEKAATSL